MIILIDTEFVWYLSLFIKNMNPIEHLAVKSSKITSIGYNSEHQILEVQFKNGHLYRYQQVPDNFYIECMMAPSVGQYFYDNIKDVFPYEIT